MLTKDNKTSNRNGGLSNHDKTGETHGVSSQALSPSGSENKPAGTPVVRAVWDPFRELSQMEQLMDAAIERAFGPSLYRSIGAPLAAKVGSFTPLVNLSETNSDYVVSAELPGIDPQHVDITLRRGSLVLRGEKRDEHEKSSNGYYKLERHFGQFQREIALPEQIDIDNAEAQFQNGVLIVRVPKLVEQTRGVRKLTINNAASQEINSQATQKAQHSEQAAEADGQGTAGK